MRGVAGRLVVLLASASVTVLAGACTSQPTILPSRDLDRPADVTFVCLGAFTPAAAPSADDGGAPEAGTGADTDAATPSTGLVVSGRPMRVCHPRQSADPANPSESAPAGPTVENRTFAFMPQSSSGQLAVVDADHWKLVDLDPANAGFNQAPLGVLPSQIVASDDGCRLMTANHGSCDLSLVDPSALLAPTLSREYPDVPGSTGNAVTLSVVPHAKGGPSLGAFAGEVAFLPHPTAEMTGGKNLCRADWNWRALVTFPSCDLIALVDLPSGEIVDGAYVRQTTTGFALEPLAGRAPVCAAPDCTRSSGRDAGAGAVDATGTEAGGPGEAGPASDGGAPDDAGDDAGVAEAGAPDGGAAEAGAQAPTIVKSPVPPLRPGPIAIIPESGRAYVGLGSGDVIVSLDVALDHLSGWGTIALNDRPLGTSRLRLSIDQYGDKTKGGAMIPGRWVGNGSSTDPRAYVQDRQYLYAVARDGSVRVVQVAHTPETECEANIDPLNLPAGVTLHDACIPVDPQHRRPTALGPGIRLPSPAVDVAVADIRPTPIDQSENTVEGAHAWVLTASGSIYLVNIDPVTRRTFYVEENGDVHECKTSKDNCREEPEPQPNALRNGNVRSYSLALNPVAGLPRVDVPPSAASVGPHVESIWTRGTANNATAQNALYKQTPIFFPTDPSAPVPQIWTVTWEGAFMPTPRLSGQIKFDQLDPGPQLLDFGNDFCRLGLQGGDIVTLTGCTNDTQCGLGKVCAHGNGGTQGAGGLAIGGLCLAKSTMPSLCEGLLETVRRYDVTKARPNVLLLAPHKDELVRPNLRPCKAASPAGDGGTDAGGGATDAGTPDAGPGDAAGAEAASVDGASDGAPATSDGDKCIDPSDPSTMKFQCVAGRCLQACHIAGKTTDCRAGRICVVFDPKPGAVAKDDEPCEDHECYCADGPDLRGADVNRSACISELLGYQLNMGGGFLVAGAATGIPRTEIAITDPDDMGQAVCARDPNLDPRTAVRIPMNAPQCADMLDNQLDSRCNPDVPDSCPLTREQRATLPPSTDTANYATAWRTLVSQIAQDLLNLDRNTKGPNACLFEGGPNDADPSTLSTGHVHALFRNNQIQFMLTNLEHPPTGLFQIRFDVHGGFQPQGVLIPPSVEVTMPVRLFLGPVDARTKMGASYAGDVPFLFVVDQRRLGRTQGGGPTRGQLLRIHPLGYPALTPEGFLPTYEDFASSGNTFPIQ